MRRLLLFAFAISGAAALVYEVTWTRALSLLMGSTTYAVSTMLATFMAGLAIGGFLGGKLADRDGNPFVIFALLEFGIGAFGLVTVPIINSLPPLYFIILESFAPSPEIYFLFQFILCALVMIVPTTLMGATFPVVSKALTPSVDSLGKWVGNAYSFNTFGAIIGSVAAGFLLIPLVGVKATTFVAAGGNMIVAVIMILGSRIKGRARVASTLLCLSIIPGAVTFNSEEARWPVSFFMSQRYPSYEHYVATHSADTVLMDKDFREGRVKLWKSEKGYYILNVGGKFEGTDFLDMVNTLLLAYLPISSHTGAESFLNIGLGAGVTLAASKEQVGDVTLVEINDGVLEAIGRFGPPGILEGVDVELNDARNYLLAGKRKFDIISSEPSYPSEASTANLFTREFYEIASRSLNPGGIFTQWLPYYVLSVDDVTMMVRTFGSVFRHVFIWKVPQSVDLIMVGSREPFPFSADEIAERARAMNASGLTLDFKLSKTPGEVREIIRMNPDIPLNTDDLPLLEFRMVRNILTRKLD
jgi:spermidine synthase